MPRKAERARREFDRIMEQRENGFLRDDDILSPRAPARPTDHPTERPTHSAFDRADELRRRQLEDVGYIRYPGWREVLIIPRKEHRILKRGFSKLQDILKASNTTSEMLRSELQASQERVARLTLEAEAALTVGSPASCAIQPALRTPDISVG